MLLWLSFVVLSAVVLAALLWPLLRPAMSGAAVEPAAADRAVYRDQLAEIAADRERGLIGAAEAEAAEREIARRLIADPGSPSSRNRPVAETGRAVLLGAIALMPAIALGLYSVLGAPTLPSQSNSARLRAPPEQNSLDELIARVEARLQAQPEDGAGWDVIAPVYLRQQRFREAADAYARAIRLLGANVKRLSGLAEASIVAADGIVGEAARAAYEQVLKLEPGLPEALFWLAIAKEQDGNLAAAAADYRAILAEAPRDIPWRPAVQERLDMVSQRLGLPAGPDAGRGAAPSAEARSAIEQLAPAEKAKAVAGMVDGLAQRLAKDGSDVGGWLRLLRAYKVMGRDQEAAFALGNARRALKDNGAALAEIEALAKSLGIGS
jgi:cytochrome c-type biogenesis protein CcmH